MYDNKKDFLRSIEDPYLRKMANKIMNGDPLEPGEYTRAEISDMMHYISTHVRERRLITDCKGCG